MLLPVGWWILVTATLFHFSVIGFEASGLVRKVRLLIKVIPTGIPVSGPPAASFADSRCQLYCMSKDPTAKVFQWKLGFNPTRDTTVQYREPK